MLPLTVADLDGDGLADMMASILSAEALLGNDEFCINYMKAYREERI